MPVVCDRSPCLVTVDLGSIGKRLEHRPERGQFRAYKTPLEFRDDVRLVWENCRTYNLPGTPVRNMGDNMSDNWEKRWVQSGVEAKWDEELRRQRAEEMVRMEGPAVANPHALCAPSSS